MILTTIFNHNAVFAMFYMVIIMATALIGVSPQFNGNKKKGLGLTAMGLLTFAMCLVPIQSGDFIYSARAFQTGVNISHFEDFFRYLYGICDNIILWRAIVYGATTLLLILTIKLLKVNQQFACFIFVITQMFMFGGLRNMFGIITMYFAVTLIFFSRKNYYRALYLIFGGIALFACTFLHRSMTMYVILLVLGLIPFGYKLARISLFAFPFLYGSIFVLSKWFINTFMPELAEHSMYYTDSERGTTLLKSINEVLKHGSYIYLLYLVLKTYSKNTLRYPNVIKFLMRYAFILMYVGFLFCGQTTGEWLYERLVWTGEISLMFVMMWFFHIYPRTKGVKVAFGIFIYLILYHMLYICTYASSGYIERYNTIEL